MNAVGYVFSYKDDDLARSLETKIQKEKVENFCKTHNINVQKIYTEPDAARIDYRPSLMELMNAATKKTFSKIIIYSFDRLSTDKDLINWIKSELKKYEIEVLSITESKIEPKVDITKKKNDLKARVRDLPSLPEVVTKVTELVQNPNSSALQLSKIISHDSGLTSRVLRLVNSAYYGFPKQISSIQHAITILGFTTIKSLVLSCSIFRIFSQKGKSSNSLDYKKFWKHSLLTAIASKKIHQSLFFSEDENIFSAAILHDIGKIILDQYDHDNYEKVLKEVNNHLAFEEMLRAEQKNCELTHQDIGHLVSTSWNLPEQLSEVIKYHHIPLESENYKKLTTIVYLGNILSHLVLDSGVYSSNYFDDNVLDEFGLSEDDLALFFSELKTEAENMGDFESFFK